MAVKKYLFIISLFSVFCIDSFAQKENSEYSMKGNEKQVDANFLFNYYNQDGDKSAVEGGQGTQKLDNIGVLSVFNIGIDSVNSVSASGGFDFYSSASTDQINAFSSASGSDLRGFLNIGYKRKSLKTGQTFGLSLGGSAEYDYSSINGGLSYSKESKSGNTEFSLGAKAFIDQWKLFLPYSYGNISTRQIDIDRLENGSVGRNSYIGSFTFSQVINKRLQVSLSADYVKMDGLNSTPFHRVFFSDNSIGLEKLPSTKTKIPVSIRANYWISDKIVFRGFYRYYYDDFGVSANTVQFELPIRINTAFTFSPFYRFHSQTASDYFAGYQEHSSSSEFYTSDFDLSAFTANKYGIDIKYYPIDPILNAKLFKTNFSFDKITFRVGAYNIDYGLNAFFGSIGLKFKIK